MLPLPQILSFGSLAVATRDSSSQSEEVLMVAHAVFFLMAVLDNGEHSNLS